MELILNLLAGLSLFLFGMNFMSQGLQKVAGAGLRNILQTVSTNKYVAVIFGAIFTAIIQSSGATTVMVVTFVNAGLMQLTQAVGIIFGANIGTTITAQLVSLKLTAIAPFILFIGAFMFLFLKKPFLKKIGEVVFGFGALFLGIDLMSTGMKLLGDYPAVVNTLAKLSNPLTAILIGLLITVVVQSSSVTVSVLLIMAGQGLVTLPICFYFILGCNIGSCTPAMMAGWSARKEATRAALIHLLYNVFGMIIISIILAFAMDPFEEFILSISGGDIKRCVANADTIYKVFQTVIFLPFTQQFISLSQKLIPGDDVQKSGKQLMYIKSDIAQYSTAASIVQAKQEISRMGVMAKENMILAMETLTEYDNEKKTQVHITEEYIDYLSHEITNYLVDVNQRQLPMADSLKIGSLFHVVNDLERIGDHAEDMVEAAEKMHEFSNTFSDSAKEELKAMFDKDMELLVLSLEMFETEMDTNLAKMISLEEEIDQMAIDLSNSHVKRMAKGKCTPETGLIYSDLVSGFERVGDHAVNVAYSLIDADLM
ncbi:MAG: Na/Pi cotransporter family protein [Lachnospiraceae bacterium]|nr:Na/Pi cotransporter family protein [Lachnospiraceae bacterium]